jgi:hypothetical protein
MSQLFSGTARSASALSVFERRIYPHAEFSQPEESHRIAGLSRSERHGDSADRQGTHYFEMRDLEGNVIEISEQT